MMTPETLKPSEPTVQIFKQHHIGFWADHPGVDGGGTPRIFLVTSADEDNPAKHIGVNLTLDTVIAYELHLATDDDLSLTFDRVIWHDEQARAVVRVVEGHIPFVIHLDPPDPIPWKKERREGPADA